MGRGCIPPRWYFYLFIYFSSFQKETINCAHHQYFRKLGHSAKVKALMWNMLFHACSHVFNHSFYTIYIHGSWTRAKQYGIKKWIAIGNVLGEHFKNLENRWESRWGFDGNTMGTLTKTTLGITKFQPTPLHSNTEPWEHARKTYWLKRFFFFLPTCMLYHFWPRLMARSVLWKIPCF